jgi:uncharacterized protein (TIGR03083 family)
MEPARLDDIDPFDVLDTEAERLGRWLESLDGESWARPSRCAGWSVRDVLAHLAGEELYNHACLDDDLDGLWALLAQEGVPGLGEFNGWCVRRRTALPVHEILYEWRTANGETRQRMRGLGRDASLPTMAGPYPAGLQALHYASELATHGDDMRVPVDAADEPARTRWRARFGQFTLAEQAAPVRVEPSDHGYTVSIPEATAELDTREFVEATVARLPDDHTLHPRLREALTCLA